MATITVTAPVIRGLRHMESVAIAKAAAQTFVHGQLVRIASGLVTDIADDGDRLGVAASNAVEAEAPSGSPNDALCDVYRLGPDNQIEINFIGTFAQTDIGLDYGLVLSGGLPAVDKADTVATRFRVMALLEGAVGDDDVRILARVLDAAAL